MTTPTCTCDLPHRSRSVLPHAAQHAVRELGAAVRGGAVTARGVAIYRQEVARDV